MSVINRFSYLLRSAAAGVALGLTGAFAAPAAGQLDGGAALSELNRPDYLHRDILLFSQGLALDDAQRMILDSLFQDFLDSFERGWQGTQDRIQDVLHDVQGMEERGERSQLLEAVIGPFDEWRSEKERLKMRFEGDVQAILNPEQAERWPQFMQQMTREKTLHYGRLSGESLNLFHLVNDLRLDDRAAMNLEPVLAQYSQELNQALEARNEILRRGQAEFIRGLRTQGNVPPPRYISEEIAARVRVRDINLRYVHEIAEALPEQHADSFRTRADEAAFPRVYRAVPAMRMIARALEHQDLDDDTREMIEDIRETLIAEMEHFNSRLRQATIDFEPQQLRNHADRSAARHTGEIVERITDPTRPAYSERDERAQYYAQLVQSLLTPEQAGMAPGGERTIRERGARERGGAVRPAPAPMERRERGRREGGDPGR